MIIPDVLALDFDGVLCDGMREYFQTSRRTEAVAWPEGPAPGESPHPAPTVRPRRAVRAEPLASNGRRELK